MNVFKSILLGASSIFFYVIFNFWNGHPYLGTVWCILWFFLFVFGWVIWDDYKIGKWYLRNWSLVASTIFLFFGANHQEYFLVSLLMALVFLGFYNYLGGQSLVNDPLEEKNFNIEIEEKVEALVRGNIDLGNKVPTRVQDIPEFPCSDYFQLREMLLSGRFILWKPPMRYDEKLFFLLAYPVERILSYLKTFIQFFGSTILSLILAVSLSWWFLLGILSFPIFMALMVPFGKKLYNRVIFRAAHQSELLFCLLYYLNEIELTTPEKDKFWSSIRLKEMKAKRDSAPKSEILYQEVLKRTNDMGPKIMEKLTSFLKPINEGDWNFEKFNKEIMTPQIGIYTLYFFVGLIGMRESNGNKDYLTGTEYKILENLVSQAGIKCDFHTMDNASWGKLTNKEHIAQNHGEILKSIKIAVEDYCACVQKGISNPEKSLLSWYKEKISLDDKDSLGISKIIKKAISDTFKCPIH